jgi:hypothetical protein
MIVLLMFLSMAPFVKADNKVPASEINQSAAKVIEGETSILNSGIIQFRGFEYDLVGQLTIGSTTYSLYCHNTLDGVYNPNTEVLSYRSDAVWYIDPATTTSANGFAGNVEVKEYGIASYPPTSAITEAAWHCTLQGFGEFAGETLVLSAQIGDSSMTGFVIVH